MPCLTLTSHNWLVNLGDTPTKVVLLVVSCILRMMQATVDADWDAVAAMEARLVVASSSAVTYADVTSAGWSNLITQ